MSYLEKLHEFLAELDKRLKRNYDITLIGGAALILEYNHCRVTYDIDVLNSSDARELQSFLEKEKGLVEKYKIPFQIVDASFFPLRSDFMDTRKEYAKGVFKHLKIHVLDLYDLILSKLDRCDAKDRCDIEWLKDNFVVDVDKLIEAYKEGRQYALNSDRVDGNFLYIMDVVFGKELNNDVLKG